eukprot:TRINITY_DN24544_c0_g1_i2.p1 TRINITY_DN24544_c0_g1~~TRINITY_DN24544_c0_g1_i2.p1  ORF type:complete len:294 (+),score=35.56 TRINITY_DN24544_c0_g1_i2:169-1050(+)
MFLRPGLDIWVLCLMPVVVSVVRLPMAIANLRQVTRILCQSDIDILELIHFFDSRLSRSLCLVSALLMPSYCCGLLWAIAFLPCTQFSELLFWEIPDEAVPCEVFSLTSSCLSCMLSVTLCSRLLAPSALRLCLALEDRQHAAPPPRAGLSEQHLQVLPSHVFGEDASESGSVHETHKHQKTPPQQPGGLPSSESSCPPGTVNPMASSDKELEETSCSICLDAFGNGQRVRKLPCGHMFHVACVDAWLKRTATCPLRCPTDIREEAQKLLSERTQGELFVSPAPTTLGRIEHP